jgi:hypothetical protein
MFILSFIIVMLCSLLEWKRICAGFVIVCLYLYCRWKSNYQRKGLESHLPVEHIRLCVSVLSQI